MPAVQDQRRPEHGAGAVFMEALAAIRREQLPTGEVPSYRRGPPGHLQYQRSPLVSAFVHDVLGCFDPRSPFSETSSLHLLPEDMRGEFVWTVARVRRRLRGFIAWQAESDGTWRFFGRGSGIDPDASTTSCAAVALLDLAGRPSWDRQQQHARALKQFRAADGRYFTFVDPRGRGYGWMDDNGLPVVGFDRVVNAQVLRFLVLAGHAQPHDITTLVDFLMAELVADPSSATASHLYPNTLCFLYCLGRAWAQARLPMHAEVRARVIARVVDLQQADGGFGGPLSTAIAAVCLRDFDYDGAPLERAVAYIQGLRLGWGGWGYEDFIIGGFGSPAWSSAASLAALGRAPHGSRS
jgi:hypothetical protein